MHARLAPDSRRDPAARHHTTGVGLSTTHSVSRPRPTRADAAPTRPRATPAAARYSERWARSRSTAARHANVYFATWASSWIARGRSAPARRARAWRRRRGTRRRRRRLVRLRGRRAASSTLVRGPVGVDDVAASAARNATTYVAATAAARCRSASHGMISKIAWGRDRGVRPPVGGERGSSWSMDRRDAQGGPRRRGDVGGDAPVSRSRASPPASTWWTIGKMKSLPGRPSCGVRASAPVRLAPSPVGALGISYPPHAKPRVAGQLSHRRAQQPQRGTARGGQPAGEEEPESARGRRRRACRRSARPVP